MSQTFTPLSDWVDQVINNIWFQPNDLLATKAYEDSISRDVSIRVNGVTLSYDQYKEVVKSARAKDEFFVDSNDELLTVLADEQGEAGSVAQFSKFTSKYKTPGEEIKSSNVIITTVKLSNGKRVLAEMAEVAA
jgi:hypothetical protein